eukprot:2744820-Pyramimonas_sp.AAC.1
MNQSCAQFVDRVGLAVATRATSLRMTAVVLDPLATHVAIQQRHQRFQVLDELGVICAALPQVKVSRQVKQNINHELERVLDILRGRLHDAIDVALDQELNSHDVPLELGAVPVGTGDGEMSH